MTATEVPAQTSHLMLDHPGWFLSRDGYAQRAFQSGGTVWMVTCERAGTSFDPVVEIVHQGTTPEDACPVVDRFDATVLPPTIRRVLLDGACDRVHRVRNPDHWDAMLMPIFRHRRPVREAAHMYRAFCAVYGTTITTELGSTVLPPRPETAITLGDDVTVVGRRMHAVRAAARGYLQLYPDEEPLRSTLLFLALQNIPNIGTWSAARIIADTTGDFSFYERAGFGSSKHWQRIAAASTHPESYTCQSTWETLSYEQKSTLITLTSHRDLAVSSKSEAANTGSRLRDLVQPRLANTSSPPRLDEKLPPHGGFPSVARPISTIR
jgi:hypothetical protein